MKWMTFCHKVDKTTGNPRMRAMTLIPGLPVLSGDFVLDLPAWRRFLEPNSKDSASLVTDWLDMDGALWSFAQQAWERREDSDFQKIWKEAGVLRSFSEVEFGAPVPRPGKIICVGLNYRDHAAECGKPTLEKPQIFSKFSTAVSAHGEPVILPKGSNQVDYEAELAVVIGKFCKGVARAHALSVVAGYANLNDVTARDFQFGDGQFQRGKSCDTFAPMGPYIVTLDELRNPLALDIRFRLNGETRQESNTREMIFDIPRIIEFITETISLEPGDVISTGTPAGVGYGMDPKKFLQPEDRMEVEIEGLGSLENRVSASVADGLD